MGCALLAASSSAFSTESLPSDLECLIKPHVTIKLGSDVPGVIRSVAVDRGDFVKAGQVVAKLESSVQEANLALAKARAANDLEIKSSEARMKFLRRKADRQGELIHKTFGAESAFDEANTNAKMSEFSMAEEKLKWQIAQLEVIHQEALLKQRTIISPINGVVVERTLSAGDIADETNPIMTVAQIDPLNVEAFVPVSAYGLINVGDKGDVFPETPINARYLATVTEVDRVIDAASGMFGIRLELPNPDHRVPAGITCKIRFPNALTSNQNPSHTTSQAAKLQAGNAHSQTPGKAR